MPVTVRYSATLDKEYEDGPQSPGPEESSFETTGTTYRRASVPARLTAGGLAALNAANGDTPGRLGSRGRCSSTDSLDETASTTSSGGQRQVSGETEFIPTRTVKSNSRPAHNPMQFVKTGICPLYKAAEQQLKKVEEVRKERVVKKDQEEEWQMDLDSWRSKRRQITQKAMQKAEELRQIELEEHDRQRRKSKTFSEMMEDRSKRGFGVKLPVYEDSGDVWDSQTESEQRMNESNDEKMDEEASFNGNKESNGWKAESTENLDASFDSAGSDNVFHAEDNDEHPVSENSIPKKTIAGHLSSQNGVSKDRRNEKSIGTSNGDSSRGKQKNIKSNGVSHHNHPQDSDTEDDRVQKNGDLEDSASTSPDLEDPFERDAQVYEQYGELCKNGVTPKTNGNITNGHNGTHVGLHARVQTKELSDDPDSDHSDLSESKLSSMTTSDISDAFSINAKREGEELTVTVQLRRFGDQREKDFGFSIRGGFDVSSGIFVDTLVPGGAAECSGLRVHDEILSINQEDAWNRSHSAVVFAIKQAVYTGRLELQIHRYSDPTLKNLQQVSCSLSNSHQAPSQNAKHPENYGDRDLTSSSSGSTPEPHIQRPLPHEKPTTKRNVAKCRSVFENQSPPSASSTCSSVSELSPEKSSTESTPRKVKNDERKKSEQSALDSRTRIGSRNKAFKEKLSSFQSMEALNNKTAKNATTGVRGSAFKEKLASFENLNQLSKTVTTRVPNSNQRDSNKQKNSSAQKEIKENVGLFEKREVFERTQSCDLLDVSYCDGPSDDSSVTGDQPEELAPCLSETKSVGSLVSAVLANATSQIDLLALDEHEMEMLSPELLESPHVEQVHNVIESEVQLTPERTSDVIDGTTELMESVFQPFEIATLTLDDETFVGEAVVSDELLPLANENGFCDVDNVLVECASATNDSAFEDSLQSELLELDTSTFPLEQEIIVVDELDVPVSSAVEPPKEKPPPPPVESESQPTKNLSSHLQRVESTKRIRKELRRLKSDFLGVDVDDVEQYIEKEISYVSPPPDMEAILRAERQLEEQLQQRRKQNELEEGVPLTNGYYHSPQNSNDFSVCSSMTSEEDLMRKEREIIESVEREEQLRMQLQQENFYETEHHAENRVSEVPSYESECRAELQVSVVDSPDYENVIYNNHVGSHIEGPHDGQSVENGPLPPVKAPKPRPTRRNSGDNRPRVAPPPPPTKQSVPTPAEKLEREEVIRLSRSPASNIEVVRPLKETQDAASVKDDVSQSAEPLVVTVPEPQSSPVHINASVNEPDGRGAASSQHTNMTRQTLSALSASPKAKIVDGPEWLTQAPKISAANHVPIPAVKRNTGKGSSKDNTSSYCQHWLVQEAELRRLTEQSQNTQNSNQAAPSRTDHREKERARDLPSSQLHPAAHQPTVRRTLPPNPTPNTASPVTVSGSPAQGNYAVLPSSSSSSLSEGSGSSSSRPLPDSVIQTLTQRVQNKSANYSSPPQQHDNYHYLNPSPVASSRHSQDYSTHSPATSGAHHPIASRNSNPGPSCISPQNGHVVYSSESPQDTYSCYTKPVAGHPPAHTSSVVPPSSYESADSGSSRKPALPPKNFNSSVTNLATLSTATHYPPTYNNPPSQNVQYNNNNKPSQSYLSHHVNNPPLQATHSPPQSQQQQMLSVSGKKKCSHCADELGRGAAMIIESLQLFYHIHCFKCCVCHAQLGNGLSGADVRVRNQKLHCHNCYSNDQGLKFSKV